MNKPHKTYVDYFSAFKSVKDIPIFAVIGNHDVM
jgi:DNA repair exonuclease SbcCD nuclease subunit